MSETEQSTANWAHFRQKTRMLQPTPRLLLLLLLPIVCLGLAEFLPFMEGLGLILLLGTSALIWLDWQRTPRANSFELERYHHRKLAIHTENAIDIIVHNHAPISINVRIRDEVPAEFILSLSSRMFITIGDTPKPDKKRLQRHPGQVI